MLGHLNVFSSFDLFFSVDIGIEGIVVVLKKMFLFTLSETMKKGALMFFPMTMFSFFWLYTLSAILSPRKKDLFGFPLLIGNLNSAFLIGTLSSFSVALCDTAAVISGQPFHFFFLF